VTLVTLPPVRPLQPSQCEHGLGFMVQMRYWLQDIRDRWQMRRGKIIDERCRHCWVVLKRFSKPVYTEVFLEAPGEPLCKHAWKQCAFCGSITCDSYLYKRYPSDPGFSWVSYNHVFGIC